MDMNEVYGWTNAMPKVPTTVKKQLEQELSDKDEEIAELRKTIAHLSSQVASMSEIVNKLSDSNQGSGKTSPKNAK